MSYIPLFALVCVAHACHVDFPWYWWIFAGLVGIGGSEPYRVQVKIKEDE